MISKGKEIALFALGSMVETAEQVAKMLEEKGVKATIVNARFATPFDKEMIESLTKEHKLLVTLAENVKTGGLGEHVTSFVVENHLDIAVHIVAIPDAYVEHGNVAMLKKDIGIDADSVFNTIYKLYQENE